MTTLRVDRALNVFQARMLEEIVVEKEVYEATKKARAELELILSGEEIPLYDALGLPLDDEEGEEGTVRDPMQRRSLGALPPETVPTDNDFNPFPGLERPLG